MPKFLSSPESISLAKQFAERFPVSGDPDEPTVISVDDLDDFALKHGCYDPAGPRRLVTDQRGQMRMKINRVSRNIALWSEHSDGTPFQIEYRQSQSGMRYLVIPVGEAFEMKAFSLPNQILSFAVSKDRRLQSLELAVDPMTSPPDLLLRIHAQARAAKSLLRRIQADCRELESEMIAIDRDVLALTKKRGGKLPPGEKPEAGPEDGEPLH